MKIPKPTLPSQAFENDFTPGWEVSKKSASPELLREHAQFIAAKRKLIERMKASR